MSKIKINMMHAMTLISELGRNGDHQERKGYSPLGAFQYANREGLKQKYGLDEDGVSRIEQGLKQGTWRLV